MLISGKRDRIAVLYIFALALALPLGGLSANAVDGDPYFFVHAENAADPSIQSTVGMEGDGAGSAPSPGPSEPLDPPKETPQSPADDSKPPVVAPGPSPKPTDPPVVDSKPAVEVPAPVFTPGPGAYELKAVSWNQMSAKQVCVDVTVGGTGAPVRDWYLTMNAATVPFNHDFAASSYQFPTWGYGFDGDFDSSGKIRIAGKNFSQWNDFSTLTAGQERTLKLCNWNTPKPPMTTEAKLTELSSNPGEWSWSASYRVSPKTQVEFFSSWKVRVDVSKLDAGYRGSSPLHSSPGASDLKITQISDHVYDIEGIGWPNMGIRQDKSVEFRLGR